jgi:pimeloyl-ACP methyl ester carboxylesterase
VSTLTETKYAQSGDISIAYQVEGDGPIDLVHSPGFVSHLEYQQTDPAYVRYFERLATFCRVIRFDKRGTGLSDRDCGIPTLEERMDDIRAVMDAAGSERAYLMGASEGGSMSALFAATYPQRVLGLILYACAVCYVKQEDYPWASTVEESEERIRSIREKWGDRQAVYDRLKNWLAPSRAENEKLVDWHVHSARYAASPSAAIALQRMNRGIDVRPILPSVSVPTLVLSRTHDQGCTPDEMKYVASLIPNSKYVELPGIDHLEWGDGAEPTIAAIAEFVTGKHIEAAYDRVLATVMFTDIVDSTKLAVLCGDKRWRELRDDHDALTLQSIERFRGKPVKHTGDGYLATFDGPVRAIECAKTIRDGVKSMGIQIRAGLHTGEIDLVGEDVSGIAVNTAARVMSLAPDSEVAVSRTVRDLVAGSNLSFTELGTYELKGIPGEWQIYQVA